MTNKNLKLLNAFTLAESRHSPLLYGDEGVAEGYSCVETKRHKVHHASKNMSFHIIKKGFTLAEVLITLGVIGVVAAVTMPTLVTNVQERVRKEQVRTVKYKFTKATEKMNSLGKIGRYESTEKFVEELKKHLTIAKICDSGHLEECWGSESFSNIGTSSSLKTYKVAELTTGKTLEALQANSGDMDTVGIVTGDGTPIILTYGKECQALDETKQYTWSVVDGKPETNATAGCVSMVFDINGKKGPNKLGTDVRTMNSLLGMVNLGGIYDGLSQADCEKYQEELGLTYCRPDGNDRYAAAVKACHDLGLHLPSSATLAQIATLQYGVTVDAGKSVCLSSSCSTWSGYDYKTIPEGYSSPLSSFANSYWSNQEFDNSKAFYRYFDTFYSYWSCNGDRDAVPITLCVGD